MGLASRDTGTFPSRLVSTGTSPQPVLARERSANPFLCPLGAITVSVRLSHAPARRMKAGTARGPTYLRECGARKKPATFDHSPAQGRGFGGHHGTPGINLNRRLA